MKGLSALIVDDEPLARDKIRTHLAAHPSVEIVGECGDGPSAIRAIKKQRPDLVFLDVQMPGSDGFSVLDALGDGFMPAIVFVTAFDKYAVRAFEFHALDYLLKPFDRERFDEALHRVIKHLASPPQAEERLLNLMNEIKHGGNPEHYPERLVVRTGGRVIFLGVEEIDRIESAANYVKLHVGKKYLLMRETMTGIETRLDPTRFVRVHRSHIVCIDRIQAMEPWTHGEYTLILKDGTRLTSSRGYREQVADLIG